MKFLNKHLVGYKSFLISLAVVATIAVGSSVTLPFSFTAGTPAKAAEVNANFGAVKSAVDDNFAKINALQTLPSYTAPTFYPGWHNVGANWQVAGYLKDPMGFVHIRGMVQRDPLDAGVSFGDTIFTFPPGYRPSDSVTFPSRCGASANTFCYIAIHSNGNVEFGGGPAQPNSFLTLDIVFDPR
jgi:hypothetical protein